MVYLLKYFSCNLSIFQGKNNLTKYNFNNYGHGLYILATNSRMKMNIRAFVVNNFNNYGHGYFFGHEFKNENEYSCIRGK